MDTNTPTVEQDWLTPSTPSTPSTASAAPDGAPAAPPRRGVKTKVAALVAAGVLAGGGVALGVTHGSSSTTGTAATAQGGAPGGAPGGSGRTGSLGFQPTAYHLDGTITAISGNTVTIKTTSGTKTYTVASSTHLMHGGATATLSAFKVGDAVVGSTTTSGGTVLNDLVQGMAGGGPGGAGAPGAGAGAAPGGTTSTS